MNEEKKVVAMKACSKHRRGMVGLILAVMTAGALTALAATPEKPDWKSVIFPSFFPKNGQGNFLNSGTSPGLMRDRMETFYEGWWREASYFRSNPTDRKSVV